MSPPQANATSGELRGELGATASLSQEILGLFFTEAAKDGFHVMPLLLRICRRWTAAALNAPTAWGYITLRAGNSRPFPAFLMRLTRHIQLSGATTLFVDLDLSCLTMEQQLTVMGSIAPCASRIGTFSVVMCSQSLLHELHRRFGDEFPSGISSLALRSGKISNGLSLPTSWLRGVISTLTVLRLTNVSLAHDGVSLPNLRVLEVVGIQPDMDHHGRRPPAETCSKSSVLFQMLSATPALRVLHLDGALFVVDLPDVDPDLQHPVIHLPEMRDVLFHNTDPGLISVFMQRVCQPKIDRLSLWSTDQTFPDLWPCLPRHSLPTLVKLSISGYSIFRRKALLPFVRLLRLCPGVVQLDISDCEEIMAMVSDFLALLCERETLLPHLVELNFVDVPYLSAILLLRLARSRRGTLRRLGIHGSDRFNTARLADIAQYVTVDFHPSGAADSDGAWD